MTRPWTRTPCAALVAAAALAVVSAALAVVSAALAAARAPLERLDGHARFVAPDGSFRFAGEASLEGLVHLDSWFVPEGAAAGFHHVYTQPEAIAAYRARGEFPDGSVLVKEIRAHTRGSYSTGTNVASSAAPVQWFVMVKDRAERFPGHPLWQEGWGWALFTAEAPSVNAAQSFAADCQGCHVPARATDWVYVNGYPRLQGD